MKRWPMGEGAVPCVGCGGKIVPGQAFETTLEGKRHRDCDDKWYGYFDHSDEQ